MTPQVNQTVTRFISSSSGDPYHSRTSLASSGRLPLMVWSVEERAELNASAWHEMDTIRALVAAREGVRS